MHDVYGWEWMDHIIIYEVVMKNNTKKKPKTKPMLIKITYTDLSGYTRSFVASKSSAEYVLKDAEYRRSSNIIIEVL